MLKPDATAVLDYSASTWPGDGRRGARVGGAILHANGRPDNVLIAGGRTDRGRTKGLEPWRG